MKKNLKLLGLKSNIIYDKKYYIFDNNQNIKLSCDKCSILSNNKLSELSYLYNKKVYIETEEDNYCLNNQLYSKYNFFYHNNCQKEVFDIYYKDTIHLQIASNVEKIKKSISYYISNVIYYLNKLTENINEDIISSINYHYSWNDYDPSKSKSSINSKVQFNEMIYKICKHNSMFSNIFKFNPSWSVQDYLKCSTQIHEYNYDIIRILALLRNFAAHGKISEKDSLYILCGTNNTLKNNVISKWNNLETILESNIRYINKIIVSNSTELSNIIYKTLENFKHSNKELKLNITFDNIFETIYFSRYYCDFPLKKLCQFIIDKNCKYKYYDYLSKKEKANFVYVLYFYIIASVNKDYLEKLSSIYHNSRNIKALYEYINGNKILKFLYLKNLVKCYYIISKKEIYLYAFHCKCTHQHSEKERGFPISTNMDRELIDSNILVNHFETKAQLLCNINKISSFQTGKRVRNNSYHGKKIRKDKVQSIQQYIKSTRKYEFWNDIFKNSNTTFINDRYEKNRYLQIRNSIVERALITILYTNKKYETEFVYSNNSKCFADYLDKKSKRYIKTIISDLCFAYDNYYEFYYHYRNEKELDKIDLFSCSIAFLGNFIDKANFNQLCHSINKNVKNIAYFSAIWNKLSKSQMNYSTNLSFLSNVNVIEKNMNTIISIARLKPKNTDNYINITSYISKIAESLGSPHFNNRYLLRNVYKNTKYYNSLIKYVPVVEVKKILENKVLIKYTYDLLSIPERQKFENLLIKIKQEELWDISSFEFKNLSIEYTIAILSLIATLINSIITRILKINSVYFIALSFLERDLRMMYNKNLNNSNALLCSNEYIEKYSSNNKYKVEYNERLSLYDTNCFKEFRNCIAHMNFIASISIVADISKIDSDFTLYHYLLQNYLLLNSSSFKLSQKYASYFNDVKTYHTPSRELIKILNLPFAYKPSRYNKLSYRSVFINMECNFDDSKRFF